MNDAASIMDPIFTNSSCDPFTEKAKPCREGNYPRFAVDVRSASDVVSTMKFAQERNLRFVIKNTGHDYLGRSAGAGSLSVWTHNLKKIEILDHWKDPYYQGKAIRMGAGVQGYDLMEATRGKGVVAVGGECATVGPAGGYTQGGGHSALSTAFGLSADNTLEWELVTANGTHLNASRTENTDLYWALSGGGGGNYGVVLSMTVKAHSDAPIGSAMVIFAPGGATNSTVNPTDRFWKAVDAFHDKLPAMLDAEAMVIYTLTNNVSAAAVLMSSPVAC